MVPPLLMSVYRLIWAWTLIDIVSTLYRVPMESLADADMVTLIDMLTEAVK